MIVPIATPGARYYHTEVVDGFVFMVGDQPQILTSGFIAASWDQVATAIRFGWRIKIGLPDGQIIVKR